MKNLRWGNKFFSPDQWSRVQLSLSLIALVAALPPVPRIETLNGQPSRWLSDGPIRRGVPSLRLTVAAKADIVQHWQSLFCPLLLGKALPTKQPIPDIISPALSSEAELCTVRGPGTYAENYAADQSHHQTTSPCQAYGQMQCCTRSKVTLWWHWFGMMQWDQWIKNLNEHPKLRPNKSSKVWLNF